MQRFMVVVAAACLWCVPATGGSTSCLDDIRVVESLHLEIEPEDNRQRTEPVFAWYGQCLLVGTPDGMRVYDANQPDQPIEITSAAVTSITADTTSATIAFAVSQVPSVYLYRPDAPLVSIPIDGDIVTGISFSRGGTILAIASAHRAPPEDEMGGYLDSRIDIQRVDGTLISTLTGLYLPIHILDMYFSADNGKLLVRAVDPGYIGDKITYWDVWSATQLWRYENLLREQKPSPNDPLLVTTAAMHDNLIALGGIDGYFNDRNFYGQAVHLWDADTGKRRMEIVLNRLGGVELVYDIGPLTLAFNSDGSVLASATGNGTLEFWDTVSGEQIDILSTEEAPARQLAFSPDDAFIAIRGDNNITIVHLASHESIVLSPWAAPP